MDEMSSLRKEVYRYEADDILFSMSWSVNPDPSKKFRAAVATFIEEYTNKVLIVQMDDAACELVCRGSFDHPYPATKVLWIPDQKGSYPDLLATSGDYLRIWRISDDNIPKLEVRLSNDICKQYCAPQTSFDWNDLEPSTIAVASIDTSITIWQIETGQAIGTTAPVTSGNVKTQLIAHDKEVCDVEFTRIGNGRQTFASSGGDGSIRVFDMRHLEHSTIMFEDAENTPILRIACNKQDSNYIAFILKGSDEVQLLDIRVPNTAVAKLRNHSAVVNGMAWSPHSPYHICTVGDDYQALIWDIHFKFRPIEDPILAYSAAGEINWVNWLSAYPEWISICHDTFLEILKV